MQNKYTVGRWPREFCLWDTNFAGINQFSGASSQTMTKMFVLLDIMHRAMVRVMIEINSPPVRWLLCNYNHNGGCAHSRGALHWGSFTLNKCINLGKLLVCTKSHNIERLKHSSQIGMRTLCSPKLLQTKCESTTKYPYLEVWSPPGSGFLTSSFAQALWPRPTQTKSQKFQCFLEISKLCSVKYC